MGELLLGSSLPSSLLVLADDEASSSLGAIGVVQVLVQVQVQVLLYSLPLFLPLNVSLSLYILPLLYKYILGGLN